MHEQICQHVRRKCTRQETCQEKRARLYGTWKLYAPFEKSASLMALEVNFRYTAIMLHHNHCQIPISRNVKLRFIPARL